MVVLLPLPTIPVCPKAGPLVGNIACPVDSKEVVCADAVVSIQLKPYNDTSGVLYLAASPIGNLADLSDRLKLTLEKCDIIACEDTRVSSKLLLHLSLNKSLVSYREENERKQTPILAEKLTEGMQVALLSDAGYPGISDPGFRLVRECHRRAIRVSPLPGPNAAITALAASGLPTHQFLFLGFFPKKKNGVIKILEEWKNFTGSIIFYESRYKMGKTLKLIREILGEKRYVCLAREITKLHETIYSGPVEEIEKKYNSESQKGEFTLVLAPQDYSFCS